jgi:hypothetical protein
MLQSSYYSCKQILATTIPCTLLQSLPCQASGKMIALMRWLLFTNDARKSLLICLCKLCAAKSETVHLSLDALMIRIALRLRLTVFDSLPCDRPCNSQTWAGRTTCPPSARKCTRVRPCALGGSLSQTLKGRLLSFPLLLDLQTSQTSRQTL